MDIYMCCQNIALWGICLLNYSTNTFSPLRNIAASMVVPMPLPIAFVSSSVTHCITISSPLDRTMWFPAYKNLPLAFSFPGFVALGVVDLTDEITRNVVMSCTRVLRIQRLLKALLWTLLVITPKDCYLVSNFNFMWWAVNSITHCEKRLIVKQCSFWETGKFSLQ